LLGFVRVRANVIMRGMNMEWIGLCCVVGSLVALTAVAGIVYWFIKAAREGGKMGALKEAAENGDLAVVQKLVAENVNIDTTNDEGRTPLHMSIKTNHRAITIFLIENGADIHARDQEDNFSPLHYAAQQGFADVVEMLIQRGADANAVANNNVAQGVTPLHCVAGSTTAIIVHRTLSREGTTEIEDEAVIVRKLVAASADVNAVFSHTTGSATALESAAQAGKVEVCRALLKAGANPNIEVSPTQNGDEIEQLLSSYRQG